MIELGDPQRAISEGSLDAADLENPHTPKRREPSFGTILKYTLPLIIAGFALKKVLERYGASNTSATPSEPEVVRLQRQKPVGEYQKVAREDGAPIVYVPVHVPNCEAVEHF
jgi:hypothetical protein